MEIETIIRGLVLVGIRNLEELTSFLVRRERKGGGGVVDQYATELIVTLLVGQVFNI